MQQPNAANVAIMADKLPNNPRKGFERTWSNCIDVIILKWQIKNTFFWNKIFGFDSKLIYLKTPIAMNVEEKYGTTVRVFRSNSWSNVRDANRAIRMCLNISESSACPTIRKNSSSHALPLLIRCKKINLIRNSILLTLEKCKMTKLTFLFDVLYQRR